MQNGDKPESRTIDLTGASVWHPPDFSQKERKAAQVLVEEVEKRTNIRWPVIAEMPKGGGPLIVLGQAPALAKLLQQDHSLPGWVVAETGEAADGFQIHTRGDQASTQFSSWATMRVGFSSGLAISCATCTWQKGASPW